MLYARNPFYFDKAELSDQSYLTDLVSYISGKNVIRGD